MQINNENDQQEVKADVNSNNKTNISTNNIRENKIPTAMYIQAFPTPFFINQQNRNIYNKIQNEQMNNNINNNRMHYNKNRYKYRKNNYQYFIEEEK